MKENKVRKRYLKSHFDRKMRLRRSFASALGPKALITVAIIGVYIDVSTYTLDEYEFVPLLNLDSIPIFAIAGLLMLVFFFLLSLGMFLPVLLRIREEYRYFLGEGKFEKWILVALEVLIYFLGWISWYSISDSNAWFFALYFLAVLVVVLAGIFLNLASLRNDFGTRWFLTVVMLCLITFGTQVFHRIDERVPSIVPSALRLFQTGGGITAKVQSKQGEICGKLILYDGSKAWLDVGDGKKHQVVEVIPIVLWRGVQCSSSAPPGK